ncbi:MAG TPA: SMC family ATPase, partial [Chthonomonadaceae bacterium]|nr:SMC family ATPase [Chthonomonadaceae bacterium]
MPLRRNSQAMIPIKLTLKNFMSYGEEGATLPLEGIHVACLSGDNGNGKSALLDAITWALWGKTRASSVKSIAEDDLIRVGADEVEVRFEFALEGHNYRVIRKRKRGKASGSEWLLTQDDGAGGWAPIGGGSQRETGKQIVQLLSMEYDTFVNSAYLQQGRADEFTRQTPDNRKRILGEILGLDRYDRLEAKAKDLYKERKEVADELEREIRLLEAQIAERPAYEARLEETRAAIEAKETQREEQENNVGKLQARRGALDALARQVEDLEAVCARMDADIQQRDRERSARLAQLKQLQSILDQREAILSDYAALQNARKRREQLEPEVQAFNKALAELQVVIGAIDVEKTRLEGDLNLLQKHLESLEARRQQSKRLEAQIAALAQALSGEQAVLRALEETRQALEAAQETFTQLRARNENCEAALKELDEVLELLAHPHAACPVCESDLSGKKREAVLARQEAKRADLAAEQKAVKKEGAAAKQALSTAQERVQALEAQRGDLAVQRSQHDQFCAQRQEIQKEIGEAGALAKQAQALQGKLEREEYAVPKRIQRRRLEQELERLGLSKQEHEAVSQRIQQLDSAPIRYQDLQHAESRWDREVQEKEQLEALLAGRQQELARERARLKALGADLAQVEQVRRETAAAEAQLEVLRHALTLLHVEEGRFLDYIARCERAQEEKKAKAEAHRKTDEERKIYH